VRASATQNRRPMSCSIAAAIPGSDIPAGTPPRYDRIRWALRDVSWRHGKMPCYKGANIPVAPVGRTRRRRSCKGSFRVWLDRYITHRVYTRSPPWADGTNARLTNATGGKSP
jgi:hypothetical protein